MLYVDYKNNIKIAMNCPTLLHKHTHYSKCIFSIKQKILKIP